jgi:hypothetical protein
MLDGSTSLKNAIAGLVGAKVKLVELSIVLGFIIEYIKVMNMN